MYRKGIGKTHRDDLIKCVETLVRKQYSDGKAAQSKTSCRGLAAMEWRLLLRLDDYIRIFILSMIHYEKNVSGQQQQTQPSLALVLHWCKPTLFLNIERLKVEFFARNRKHMN